MELLIFIGVMHMYGLKLTVLLTILPLQFHTALILKQQLQVTYYLTQVWSIIISKHNRRIRTDKVGSGQGFTIDSGIQAFQNELEAKGEGIVSDTGSLVVSQLQNKMVVHTQLQRIV